jgi:hypothetical protein
MALQLLVVTKFNQPLYLHGMYNYYYFCYINAKQIFKGLDYHDLLIKGPNSLRSTKIMSHYHLFCIHLHNPI